jgi:DNA-binding beta-propeller fold protein YncE
VHHMLRDKIENIDTEVWFKRYNLILFPVLTCLCLLLIYLIMGGGGARASILYSATNVLGQNDFTSGYQDGISPDYFGLNSPQAIAVDSSDHLLFVADSQNNRVLVYQLNSSEQLISHDASYVIGQKDFSSQACVINQSTLCDPTDVLYDSASKFLFIADSSNGRIMIFDLSNGISTGMNASYELGSTTFTQGGCGGNSYNLCQPLSMAYDPAHKYLFVADLSSRVDIFNLSGAITNGMNPDYILGQSNFLSATQHCASGTGSTQSGFCGGTSIAYDANDQYLFVANGGNYRVTVFNLSGGITNDMNASYVLGQPNFTSVSTANCNGVTSNSGMCNVLSGMTYDPTNKLLYVSDTANSRVLVFDLSSGITNDMSASYVIGQPNYTIASCFSAPATTQSDICGPGGLLFDPVSHELFITDYNSSRVLIFNLSNGITDGMGASDLLGQTNYISNFPDAKARPNNYGFIYPYDVALDAANYHLFVADSSNNRVLVYNLDTNNNLTSTSANYVLGQSDFSGSACNLSQSQFCQPDSLTFDSADNELFVGDGRRISVYNFSSGISSGMNASYVLGQPNFTSNISCATTQSSTCSPAGLAYNTNKHWLFVSDSSSNRVLIFDLSSGITNGMNASYVLGQTSFTSNSCGVSAAKLCNTDGLAFDSANNRLFVSDFGSSRTQVFNLSSTVTNGMSASFSITGLQTTGLSYDDTNNRLFAGAGVSGQVNIMSVPSNTSTNLTAASATTGSIGQSMGCSFADSISQTNFCNAYGITFDPGNDRLYAADRNNNRVLQFDLAMAITTVSLSNGQVGDSYSQTLQTVNANAPVTYAVTSGGLPSGLNINSSTGSIGGQPDQAGTFTFTVQATDSDSNTANRSFSITVLPVTSTSSSPSSTSGSTTNPNMQAVSSPLSSQGASTTADTSPVSLDASPQFISSNDGLTADTVNEIAPGSEFTFTLPAITNNKNDTTQSTTSASSSGSVTHTVLIDNIDPTSKTVDVTIHSDPINVTLHLNQSQNIDVGDVGSDNFGIELVGFDTAVNPVKADLKFWKISATNKSEGAVIGSKKIQSSILVPAKTKSYTRVYVLIGCLALAIVLTVGVLRFRRHLKSV